MSRNESEKKRKKALQNSWYDQREMPLLISYSIVTVSNDYTRLFFFLFSLMSHANTHTGRMEVGLRIDR
jgi:hypothetical protein